MLTQKLLEPYGYGYMEAAFEKGDVFLKSVRLAELAAARLGGSDEDYLL